MASLALSYSSIDYSKFYLPFSLSVPYFGFKSPISRLISHVCFLLNSYRLTCQLADGFGDAGGIVAAFGIQFFLFSVLNDGVGDAKALNAGVVAIVSHKLKYCASETTHQAAIFYSYNLIELLKNFMQECFIKWLGKAHIVMGRLEAIFTE